MVLVLHNLLNSLYLHLLLSFTSPKRARCRNKIPAKKKRMRRLEWPFCERYESANKQFLSRGVNNFVLLIRQESEQAAVLLSRCRLRPVVPSERRPTETPDAAPLPPAERPTPTARLRRLRQKVHQEDLPDASQAALPPRDNTEGLCVRCEWISGGYVESIAGNEENMWNV